MFDWNDARYVLAVARRGSLSNAARHLGVQQTTVGRRLTALEAALDTKLFDRTSEGWVLTPAGETFVVHAERIEAESLAVERRLAGQEAVAAGRVRITAPQAFGFAFVAPLLARMQVEHPEILVELVADNAPLNLARREADLALRLGRPPQQRLVMRRLGAVVDGLYASRAYLASAARVRAGALSGHTFVNFHESFVRPDIQQWVARHLRGARCVLEVNGTEGIVAAVRAGMGIGVLPCWLADADPALERVLPDLSVTRPLWLVVHHDLRRSARVRAVVDFLIREVSRAASRLAGAPASRGG